MSLLPSLPDGLPWHEQQAFALLDGAAIDDLPARLKRISPAAHILALYDRPPLSALRDVSPLLVPVQDGTDPVVRFLLQQADEESGVLLFSAQPTHSVAEHLRKLLLVELPIGAPVLLRLADAAVMQALFAGDDQTLFGPLTHVVTADCIAGAWICQRPHSTQRPELSVPYRLNDGQDAALDRVDRRRVLLELDKHLRQHFPDFHAGEPLALRWPILERIETQAMALNVTGFSGLLHYANVVARLGDRPLGPSAEIQRLLHSPSLQSPEERVALAAALACQPIPARDRS